MGVGVQSIPGVVARMEAVVVSYMFYDCECLNLLLERVCVTSYRLSTTLSFTVGPDL